MFIDNLPKERHLIVKMLREVNGHIFNLGHGISQFTPPEHVSALVEAVLSRSQALRK